MTTRIYLQMTFFPKYFFDVDNFLKIGVQLLYSVVLLLLSHFSRVRLCATP